MQILKYIKNYRTIIGYNMNIINNNSVKFYSGLGVENFIRSIEGSLTNELSGGLYYEGFPTLMTWCHCPYKVSCNSHCDMCKFNDKLLYKLNDGKVFKIRRYKIINCYFELIEDREIKNTGSSVICDLR